MKIDVNDKGSKFSFTSPAKTLDSCIAKVASVVNSSAAAGSDKSYILHSNGTDLIVIGYTADTLAASIVPDTSVSKSGAFSFDPTMLSGVIKGRGDMTFDFTGTECAFKLTKGKYNGRVVTQPIAADAAEFIANKVAPKSKGAASISIDDEVMGFLTEGLAATAIKDIYTNGTMLSYVIFSPKGFTVFSFDNHHFAYYRTSKVKVGDVKIAASQTVFALMNKMFEGDKAKFTIRPESIRLDGKFSLMVVPTVQANDKDFTMVPELLKSTKDYAFQCQFSNTDLMGLASNLITLHSSNSMLELAAKKDASMLGITFQTQNGSASDSLKVTPTKTGTVKVRVDPRILRDSFQLIQGTKEDPTLGIVAGKMLTADAKLSSGALLTIVNSVQAG